MNMITVKELNSRTQIIEFGRLGKRCHEECAPAGVPFTMDAVYEKLQNIANDPDRSFLNAWVAYADDRPIGFIVGSCTEYVYNYDRCARQENLYVIPEYRGTPCALKLIRAFEEWARLLGALEVFLGVGRDNTVEAKKIGKLFPRIGYNFAGTYYVKKTSRRIV